MQASEVINLVRALLSDTDSGNYRWSDQDLWLHLTAALTDLVTLRPDACSEIRAVELSPGAEQALPADALRFLGGVENRGSDGSSVGDAVRNVDLATKDAFDPGWANRTPSLTVRECLYDPATPDVFWVWPQVPAAEDGTVHLAVRLAVQPPAVTANSTDIKVKERHRTALAYAVLANAYDTNTDAGSKQLAASYRQAFLNILGIKAQAAQGMPPAVKGDGE